MIRQGRYQRAIEVLQGMDPTVPQVSGLLAYAQEQLDTEAEAARQRDEKRREIQTLLESCQALLRAGSIEAASARLAELAAKYPTDPGVAQLREEVSRQVREREEKRQREVRPAVPTAEITIPGIPIEPVISRPTMGPPTIREPLPVPGRRKIFLIGVCVVAAVVLAIFFLGRGPAPAPKAALEKLKAAATISKPKLVVPPEPKPKPSAPPEPVKAERRTGDTRANEKDGLTYVWIARGTFRMGCSSGDSECYDDEKPAHEVTITKGFWIGRTLVTQAAYQRVTGTNPSHYRGVQLPVDSVNWNESKTYCQAAEMRLPTEAEWEYAARAGTTGSRYNELGQIAWYYANSGNTARAVGQRQANAWGLYDMLGNVFEWVADPYGAYTAAAQQDPAGPTSGSSHVLRGGSWGSGSRDVRASLRYWKGPGPPGYNFGFRCAGD
jgi:formylglycine-generating enzyme required for sulfatase activity